MLKMMWSIFSVTVVTASSASAGMLPGPAALLRLVFLMAMLISSIVGGPTSIRRSMGAAPMLGGFSVAGRFRSSLKCSAHLFRCSACCCPFQSWHLGLLSEWSSPLLDTSRRLTAAYRRIDL
ncbi:unnamed protein product [Schistosoma margrebowiei]|uniref:Secreted protein n=1 Tax=Schistosoma margrebowiei TaxID=48269 RepID=A0A3P8D0C0_9TREM|nr:unnamed protein product [Schistosoma margrebowiei]